jgi:prepilin-type N-terminal cleavage/methylation domain-containing protein
MQPQFESATQRQRGFTLLEILFATILLAVGMVAVAQLVPLSIRLNTGNRHSSMELVMAQRELDEIVDQPLTAATFSDPQGVLCPAGTNCDLGDPTQPNQLVGSAVNVINNQPQINFNAAQVAGYSFNYVDPNDPFQGTYDIRWAVITFVNNGNTMGRRIILGILRRSGNSPFQPTTLDTMVEK